MQFRYHSKYNRYLREESKKTNFNVISSPEALTLKTGTLLFTYVFFILFHYLIKKRIKFEHYLAKNILAIQKNITWNVKKTIN